MGLQGQHWDWSARCQYTVTGVRQKVWFATYISVWQHAKLSWQIRPWDTLACWWDVKQPTNQPLLTCYTQQYKVLLHAADGLSTHFDFVISPSQITEYWFDLCYWFFCLRHCSLQTWFLFCAEVSLGFECPQSMTFCFFSAQTLLCRKGAKCLL